MMYMNKNMSSNVKNFRDLICWQKAKSLQKKVYKVIPKIPYFEKDNLKSQVRKSVSSIGANIAEGAGQLYKRKEITHYNIALGSASEVRNWMNDALMFDYITKEEYDDMDSEAEEIIKMLYGLIRKLQREVSTSEEKSNN